MSNLYELDPSPDDNISSLRFSPSGDKLAVASWNCSITIYSRTTDGETPFKFASSHKSDAPILDLTFGKDENTLFYVGLGQHVFALDIESESKRILSTHSSASSKIVYSKDYNMVLSTSWDGTMHAHDGDSGVYVRITLAAKPFAISLNKSLVIVAMADRKMSVYELSEIQSLIAQSGSTNSNAHSVSPPVWQQRESSLKFMARAIACMPDGTGFAVSSIEGRVGVEWFAAEMEKEMYAFKCHRQTSKIQAQGENDDEITEVDVIYPVNALAFHPVHGTFATGGGDGVVTLWDAQTKRRVRQYSALGASVAALDFSANGKFLAVGVSPGFEDGEEKPEGIEGPGSAIRVVIRALSDKEAVGKPPKSK